MAAQTTTSLKGSGAAAHGTAANPYGGLVAEANNAQPGGTLQLGRNARTFGTFTIAKGTLADNGQTITALGDVLNSSAHNCTGTGSLDFGRLDQPEHWRQRQGVRHVTLTNAVGATTVANQEINNVLTLDGWHPEYWFQLTFKQSNPW
jgi:hypothetical protein